MADAIYRSGGRHRPSLWLAASVYPGLNCDETPFIDTVARSVQFPCERCDGREWHPADERFHVAFPWRSQYPGTSYGWHRIAEREGARVGLTGFGGDELLSSVGILPDLAVRGYWRTLLRETALLAANSGRSPWAYLKSAVQGASPLPLQRLWEEARSRQQIPAWLGPRLQALWGERQPRGPEPLRCISHTQQAIWNELVDMGYDIRAYLATRAGIQLRSPFWDARLVRFVLAIPLEYRLPGGWGKRLLREAMADILPPEIAQRKTKMGYKESIRLHIERDLGRHSSLPSDGLWLSEPYVDRLSAQKLLRNGTAAGDTSAREAWWYGWRILLLEQWLRDLAGVRW
jgi:asparagine synthetase B (glutamine-hydrolysing)